jgi:hypothetical protein
MGILRTFGVPAKAEKLHSAAQFADVRKTRRRVVRLQIAVLRL